MNLSASALWECTWQKCCYHIDLFNWIVNSRAKRVASLGGLNFFKPENINPTDMADAINSSITCLAIDDAMNSRNVVDVDPYWKTDWDGF